MEFYETTRKMPIEFCHYENDNDCYWESLSLLDTRKAHVYNVQHMHTKSTGRDFCTAERQYEYQPCMVQIKL